MVIQLLKITYCPFGDEKKKITISESDNNVVIEVKKVNNRETVVLKALNDIMLYQAENSLDVEFDPKSKFFLNGYQSWTDTKECYLYEYERIARRAKRFFKKNRKNDTFNKTRDFLVNKYAFDRYGDVLFYEYDKNKLHGYDVFYIKGDMEFFSFNYNFKNAFLVYEVFRKENKLNIVSGIRKYRIKKGDEFTVFDYSLFDSYKEGLASFYELFKEKDTNKIFGYTSWYNYYQNINEEIILRDLAGLDSRFNLFQIDDGYETYVGDWFDIDEEKFPNGLKGIVDRIHERGFKAGIWLAPFVAEEKSRLFREHTNYFKRDNKGNLIKCGGNWSGFYVLDMNNKDAMEYVRKSLQFYLDLGFDFFKLDFLYAISLPRYYNRTKAMATDIAYKFIRDILGDKLILGCGAIPSISALYFDYLRVGPDVSLIFDDIWYMKYAHRERISTKITLQNTIYRSIFNKHLFLNDPDVFLLRDDNISLSAEQKRALLTINSLFGSVLMTSDNIANYDEEKNKMLDQAFDMFYHASDVQFKRIDNKILIDYKLSDKDYSIIYDPEEGVLIHGQD